MARETCKKILKKICAEAGKRESSPFCMEVRRHIESCPDCRIQAASLRGTLELYWCLERKEVPPDVSARLRKALNLENDQERPTSS